ncbi:hypothetical protein [Jeotgalibacillus proteolyticus]|uniref:Uncharacterized protein n=1 Tax=Jeotgalibacillus proteolyticus TaxID=2082395 RepID=A0A2S5G6X4_9BACL|nr:hypothetical protein [Jeotgalibacillus proteolyticus]PPA68736.1 hypothetical protein C4B60_19415 [Jeotgalibacillus proteolyticus]
MDIKSYLSVFTSVGSTLKEMSQNQNYTFKQKKEIMSNCLTKLEKASPPLAFEMEQQQRITEHTVVRKRLRI